MGSYLMRSQGFYKMSSSLAHSYEDPDEVLQDVIQIIGDHPLFEKMSIPSTEDDLMRLQSPQTSPADIAKSTPDRSSLIALPVEMIDEVMNSLDKTSVSYNPAIPVTVNDMAELRQQYPDASHMPPTFTDMDAATLETDILKSSMMASDIPEFSPLEHFHSFDYLSDSSNGESPKRIGFCDVSAITSSTPWDIPRMTSFESFESWSSAPSPTSSYLSWSSPVTSRSSPVTSPRSPASDQGDSHSESTRTMSAPQFLLGLLEDPRHNPATIYWVDQALGVFRIARSKMVAREWAESRRRLGCRRVSHSYENFSRTIRHHYKKGEIVQEEGRLTYRFGPRGPYQPAHHASP